MGRTRLAKWPARTLIDVAEGAFGLGMAAVGAKGLAARAPRPGTEPQPGFLGRNLPGLNKGLSDFVHGPLADLSPLLHAGAEAMATLVGFKVCFAGETPMRTEWGSIRADEVTVGTRLLSRDEYNMEGAVEAQEVEQVFVREGLITVLKVMGQTIRSTAEHPFFVRAKGWAPLNQIRAGDAIWTEASGWVTVESVEETGQWETVYNFRVAQHHTYFVGSEEWGFSVWAHNVCSGETVAQQLDSVLKQNEKLGAVGNLPEATQKALGDVGVLAGGGAGKRNDVAAALQAIASSHGAKLSRTKAFEVADTLLLLANEPGTSASAAHL